MSYFKELVFNNLFIKLISLFFAITLWFYITPFTLQDTLEVNYVLPLELKNIPENMLIVGKVDSHISVRLKGRQHIIRDIEPDQLRVRLDLSNVTEGIRLYTLDRDNINVSNGVDVVRLEPKVIKIAIVKTLKKEVKVKINITGEPAPGYIVKGFTVTPAVILVEGPASEIKALADLEGPSVDVTGRNSSFSEEVKIGISHRNARISGKGIVVVNVEIDKS